MSFNIPFKSGGGGGLIMPSLVTNQDAGINMKQAVSLAPAADNATFWAEIDISHTEKGFESVSLTPALNTLEQTIVDVSGSGVLTHVISSSLSAGGVMTIRVTIDGKVTTFTSPTLTIANSSRFNIGHFLGFFGVTSPATNTGYGSSSDSGYDIPTDRFLMTTPVQALMTGGIGMKFETDLKVTIQGSVNISVAAEKNKSAVCYTNFIPEGL